MQWYYVLISKLLFAINFITILHDGIIILEMLQLWLLEYLIAYM